MTAAWGQPVGAAPTAAELAANAPMEPPPLGAAVDKTTGDFLRIDGRYIAKDDLLLQWSKFKDTLSEVKDEESRFRKAVVNTFANPERKKGTENVDIGNGWKLKVVKSLSYSLKSKAPETVSHNDAVMACLNAIAAADPVRGPKMAAKLVSWKPELSETVYQGLNADDADDDDEAAFFLRVKTIIDEVVEYKDGAAQVSIVPPKAE